MNRYNNNDDLTNLEIPINDYDENEYEDNPNEYIYLLNGPIDELEKVRELVDDLTKKWGTPLNEGMRFVPKPILLKHL